MAELKENIAEEKKKEKKKSQLKTSLKAEDIIKKDYLLIVKALKEHGAEAILYDENKLLDILAAIIYKKYSKKIGDSEDEQDNKKRSFSFMNFIALASFVIMVGSLIWPYLQFKRKDTGSKINEEDVVIKGEFEFKRGNSLSSQPFFGKEELFKEWTSIIMEALELLNSDMTKDELEEQMIYTKLSFILFGPPGTGKTFFVQYMIRKIDFELKKRYLEEQDDKEYKILLAENNIEKINAYIDEQPSRIYFCLVQPSLINSKYIGESEKMIKQLFLEARNLIKDKRWVLCVLFFDEGDVFFNIRSSNSDAGSISDSHVKSELLTKIGVKSADDPLPLFIFAATNLMKKLDPAFKRRFSNQAKFNNLSYLERIEFFKFLLSNFDLDHEELQSMAAHSEKKSQSFISEKIQQFIKKNKDGKNVLYLKKYMNFLKINSNNENMV